jgi:hypothetical protein
MSIKPRKLMLIVGLALFTTAVQSQQSQQFSDQPLSLAIANIAGQVTSGSEVKISINLTNTSDNPIVLEDDGIFWYLVDVTRTDGKQVKQTEKGKELKKKQALHESGQIPILKRMAIKLAPGQTKSGECTISDLYDMTDSGEYTIQLQLKWNGQLINSNKLEVSLNP